jgi:hypothetical protein
MSQIVSSLDSPDVAYGSTLFRIGFENPLAEFVHGWISSNEGSNSRKGR